MVIQTFDVSEQAAQNYAAEVVSLAEGWGSPETAVQLDWSYRIRKDLGQKLRWKSEVEREKFFAEQQQWHKDYDKIFPTKNRA